MRILLSVAAILIVAAISFIGGFFWKSAQVIPPSPNVALIDQVNLMQLRRACVDQTHKSFKEDEQRKSNVIESFTAHYNTRLKKCFALYSTTTVNTAAEQSSEFMYLEDAFERVQYGDFDAITSWEPGTDDKPRILICERTPNGEAQPACKSRQEWNAFVERYMESIQPNG